MRRSALKSIRAFCIECQGDSFQGVAECVDLACAFYPFRYGVLPRTGQRKPLAAIKAYCFENCQGGSSRAEVENCQGDTAVLGPCPVYPFRLGVNPNISEETREKRRLEAQKRATKGVFGFSKQIHQTPFQPPESKEATSVRV